MHTIARLLLISVCMISFSHSRAQKFTLPELLSLNRCSMDSFDTYVTKRGYQFYKPIKSAAYGNAILYAFKQNDSTLKADYFIRKYLPGSINTKNISFQTIYVSDYLSLKDSLKTMGFTTTSSTPLENDNGLQLVYAKDALKILLNSYLSNTDPKKKIAVYEITIIE